MSPARSLGARLGRATATLLHPRPAKAAAPSGAFSRAFARGGRALLSHFGQAARPLLLRLSAVLYFVFAVGFAAEGIRVWHAAHFAHHAVSLTEAPAPAQLELALALVFVYFGISSLARSHPTK